MTLNPHQTKPFYGQVSFHLKFSVLPCAGKTCFSPYPTDKHPCGAGSRQWSRARGPCAHTPQGAAQGQSTQTREDWPGKLPHCPANVEVLQWQIKGFFFSPKLHTPTNIWQICILSLFVCVLLNTIMISSCVAGGPTHWHFTAQFIFSYCIISVFPLILLCACRMPDVSYHTYFLLFVLLF